MTWREVLPQLIAELPRFAALVSALAAALMGWWLRGRSHRVMLDQLVEARSEQRAATKLATLRAQVRRLEDELETVSAENARHRRAVMSAENIRAGRGS